MVDIVLKVLELAYINLVLQRAGINLFKVVTEPSEMNNSKTRLCTAPSSISRVASSGF